MKNPMLALNSQKHGNEIIELSDEETEKILKLLEEIAQETAKDLDGQGYNGTELLNKSRELAEKYLD